MKKCAVFSCKGLGDGLIALVLANNLRVNGAGATTFHPFLHAMQSWFPDLPIGPFPDPEELSHFDAFFIIYEQSEWMQKTLAYCETHYPDQTVVLNPIATHNRDYAYWEIGKFKGSRTFVDNIVAFCRDGLHLKLLTKDNGIRSPQAVTPRRFPRRVVLHPTSSRAGKDWPKEKYAALAENLERRGFEPVFILNGQERVGWDCAKNQAPHLDNLEAMAQYIAESGYMIGNDSGIGHLASCLGLPTVTVCRSYETAQFWRPAWSEGRVAAPGGWIPNIKGLRLRDAHWKKWVSVKCVLEHFLILSDQFSKLRDE